MPGSRARGEETQAVREAPLGIVGVPVLASLVGACGKAHLAVGAAAEQELPHDITEHGVDAVPLNRRRTETITNDTAAGNLAMRRAVTRAMIAVAAGLTVLLLYGVIVEPRLILDEERLEVRLPGLGDGWSGETVAVFSDLQVGMWFANTGMVERVVDRVVEEQPAAVLLGGDFVYSGDPNIAVQVDTVLDLLAPLTRSGIPMFAVLGNHDYAIGAAEELTTAMQENGITVLRNESVAVSPPPGPTADALHVVGVGPARPGRADVDKALEGLPDNAPRLVLMHNPTSFPELPAGSAPLAVAGHTHCGQIAIPGAPRWSYLGLTEEEALVADGFAPPDYGARDNRLFVTCGIGFSLLPIRINAPPQLVFIELNP